MKDRRKMPLDVWPAYSPGYMPKMTLGVSLFILIMGALFFYRRHQVMSQQAQESIKQPVEIRQDAPPTPPAELTDVPIQGIPHPTPEARQAYETWVKWRNKRRELSKEYSQYSQEFKDALPATEAERERYKTDEQFQREVDRKMREASEKMFETIRKRRAHDKEEPPVPYIR